MKRRAIQWTLWLGVAIAGAGLGKAQLGRAQAAVPSSAAAAHAAAGAASAAPPAAAPRPTVATGTLKQVDPHGRWQFSYRYPRISVAGALMGVQGICQDFNRKMEQQAQESLKAFKEAVAANESTGSPVKAKSERRVSYQLVTRTPGLLAVRFTQLEYLRGQAHPTTTVSTQNFTLQGQFLRLADLFATDPRYLEKLSSSVGKELAAQASRRKFEIIDPQGFAAAAPNFQAFLITPRGLVFVFNPASVAASYVGVLSATVPWSTLAGDLSQQGQRIQAATR